jgi:antitoxin (DNA-binding transcriptional repressor) of toxin-antitoxin stability system
VPRQGHNSLYIAGDVVVIGRMAGVDHLEARSTLGALLDQVEKGAEVTITRRGRPVARLVPADAGIDRGRARSAADNLVARRKGVSLGGLRIKDLIDEGRPRG